MLPGLCSTESHLWQSWLPTNPLRVILSRPSRLCLSRYQGSYIPYYAFLNCLIPSRLPLSRWLQKLCDLPSDWWHFRCLSQRVSALFRRKSSAMGLGALSRKIPNTWHYHEARETLVVEWRDRRRRCPRMVQWSTRLVNRPEYLRKLT